MYYIYEMRHTPTGRVYVGQHKLPKGKTPETDGYYGSGTLWRRIYKAHPNECVKEILEVVKTKKEVDELEKKYIAHYRNVYGELCVNLADGGEGGCGKHSESTKKKISESHKGMKHTEAAKEKMRGRIPWSKGKHLSEEHKQKIGEANRGKTPWSKGKKCPQLSEKQRGEKNPNFGKHLSEEQKQKLSESKKGKHHSEATRKKMSESRKGKSPSEATREKISLSLKGRKLSEETRRKMSLSLKGRTSPNKGKHLSEEHRKKLSESHKGKTPWNKGKKKGTQKP